MLSIHYKLKLVVLNMSEKGGLLKYSGLYSLSWKPISRSSVIIFKYVLNSLLDIFDGNTF